MIAALPAFSKCDCGFFEKFEVLKMGDEFWIGYESFTCDNCGFDDRYPSGHIMKYHSDIEDHLGNKSHIATFKYPPKICPACKAILTTAIIPCGPLTMPSLFHRGENGVDIKSNEG